MPAKSSQVTRHALPPPEGAKPQHTAPPPPPGWRHWLLPIAFGITLVLWIVLPTLHTTVPVNLTYSQFLHDVSAHKVRSIAIAADGTASGTLVKGATYTTVIPVALAGPSLLAQLQAANVSITANTAGPSFSSEVITWLILLAPFLVIIWFWIRLSRHPGTGALSGALSVGRSKAKVFDAERPSTTFADVAGYDGTKAEIEEVVDFLRKPERYRQAGAVAPRGVLMIGPPGTGKTLLARAVAGEAGVPFFSVAGSSFVEMYVGVGAARVRDLFTEAAKRSPAIVFVDEVDAIGQRRSGHGAIVSNDEREQTLNQLLSEMDGFDPAEGIVVLAATNRPEILDPALLRPGRFDRQLVIPLPTLSERRAILAVHCKGKKLDKGVDLEVIARGTPGFSGADLANLANEAAIVAVRNNRRILEASDFDEARDRILLGRREGSNVLLPEEKHAVAIHESGHAIVAALCTNADPVAKVTILPAGQTLGVTEQLPLVERHLYSEEYLHDSLAVRMGGRAAELVELGQGSTGASNDLAQATDLATKMVRELGLSKRLGPVGYPSGGSAFLGTSGSEFSSRPFAETTQAIIDTEVARMVKEAEERAITMLEGHRSALGSLVDLLLENETVDGAAVYHLVDVPLPGSSQQSQTVAPRSAHTSSESPKTRSLAVGAEPTARYGNTVVDYGEQ